MKLASANKLKRNKTMILIFLPVIICIFAIGWLMYWVGESKGTQKAKTTTDNITIGAITLEEGKVKVR